MDGAALADLNDENTARLLSIFEGERIESLCNIIRLLDVPGAELSDRMRLALRFVAEVIDKIPQEMWSRHGSAFVSKLLNATRWTWVMRDVLNNPRLVAATVSASRARFTIVDAHVWVAPWSQIFAPQIAAKPAKYAVVFVVEVTPCVQLPMQFETEPVRLVVSSRDMLDAFEINEPANFCAISPEWMAETLIRYRMIDEMRASEEDEARVEQRALLMQRVRDLVDVHTRRARNVFPARRISQSRMWRLAQCSLTKDVIWNFALSVELTPRDTKYRVPIRGGIQLAAAN